MPIIADGHQLPQTNFQKMSFTPPNGAQCVGTGNCTDPCVCTSPTEGTEASTSSLSPFAAEHDIPRITAEEKPRKTSADPGRNVVKHRCKDLGVSQQERPNGYAIAKDEVLKTT